jgi:hypothetical protein
MALMAANARAFVPYPGPGYAAQPYGLFTVAPPRDMPEHADVFGLEYQSPYCGIPSSYAVNCPPASKAAALTGAYTTVTGDPFVVLAGMECGAMTAQSSGQSPDEYTRNFVIAKLKGFEQRLVESVFSRGLSGQAPGLSTAAGTVTVPTPTVDNLVNAIQALEGAYAAAFGLPGVIHLPAKAVEQMANGHLVDMVNGVWQTALGSVVSIGNYQGYGPGDVAPADLAHRWIYMTGPVTVWRQPDSDIFVSPWAESIDKVTNQVHRFAERSYIVTYECVSFAVLANIEACC